MNDCEHTIAEFIKEEAHNDPVLRDCVCYTISAHTLMLSLMSQKQKTSFVKIMKFTYSSLLDEIEKRDKDVSTNERE